MSDLISRSAVIQVLKECHLDEKLFEKDVFDNINAIPTSYDVEKSIDEIETKVYKDAVCVGCGYLKDNICTYKGSACGVSKPMLESIKRVFENTRKGGVNE